ncbi:MAG TPA: anthranilate synthase component I family protein [Bacteroidia bacterium]
MLKKITYTCSDVNSIVNIERLNERFNRVCVFDSNPDVNDQKHIASSKIIALGTIRELIVKQPYACLEELEQFSNKKRGWLFGYLAYDLKNPIEQLESKNKDRLEFPLIHFFEPKVTIQITGNASNVFFDDEFVSEKEAKDIYEDCFSAAEIVTENDVPIIIQATLSKEDYIDAVNKLKSHIKKGDIYEINFCQEFYAENVSVNTASVFEKLNAISSAPFSAYGKFGAQYLLCASPERFLRKRSNSLISQPIKGTIRRSKNKQEDDELKKELRNNGKEQSENVMIVDLVRNDLSRIAKKGTVEVKELFGIYTFKQVHQMISTISCELKEGVSFTEILKSTFPMGSMTGAPKVNAMKLIEQYESSKRGLYSGAIGYISPEGDFDFNVVIRSILYNAEKKALSFMVGSAITDKADAEQEYEECLLKAKAMFEALGTTINQ